MKPEQLSDALNYLDDELLQEAQEARLQTAMPQRLPGQPAVQPARQQSGQPAPGDAANPAPEPTVRGWGKKTVWMRRAAAAACLALCLGGGAWLWQRGGCGQPLPIDPAPGPDASQPGWTPAPDLPLLTIDDDLSSGMGFEGLMFYDSSEMYSANPWTKDAQLSYLPVFRNTLRADAAGAYDAGGISEERFAQMRSLLLQTAQRLGMDTASLVIGDNAPSEEEKNAYREKFESIGEEVPEGLFDPTELNAKQDGVRIEVEANMTVTIQFEPALALPLDFPLDFRMSHEHAQTAAEYLREAFAALIGMQDPQIDICGGDYTFSGEHGYGVDFFEGAGDPVQQILHFNFDRASFSGNDEGRLWIVRLYQTDLSDKIGDYPIIPPGKAKELLLAGSYITTVPGEYGTPREDLIVRTELVYRYRRTDEYYMPYYRFYIELPEQKRENGLNTYGAFYVPAVEGQYLTNMPVWDGSFN